KDYFEENKRNIIKQAKLEAQQIIKNANKLIENTISDIKSAKAEKEKTKQLRENLNAELKKHEVKPVEKKAVDSKQAEIAVGDWVKLTDSGNVAKVLEVSKENLIIAFGELKSVVKKRRVEKIAQSDVPKDIRRASSVSYTQSASEFVSEIDV